MSSLLHSLKKQITKRMFSCIEYEDIILIPPTASDTQKHMAYEDINTMNYVHQPYGENLRNPYGVKIISDLDRIKIISPESLNQCWLCYQNDSRNISLLKLETKPDDILLLYGDNKEIVSIPAIDQKDAKQQLL